MSSQVHLLESTIFLHVFGACPGSLQACCGTDGSSANVLVFRKNICCNIRPENASVLTADAAISQHLIGIHG